MGHIVNIALTIGLKAAISRGRNDCFLLHKIPKAIELHVHVLPICLIPIFPSCAVKFFNQLVAVNQELSLFMAVNLVDTAVDCLRLMAVNLVDKLLILRLMAVNPVGTSADCLRLMAVNQLDTAVDCLMLMSVNPVDTVVACLRIMAVSC